jgi:hypothetical protein
MEEIVDKIQRIRHAIWTDAWILKEYTCPDPQHKKDEIEEEWKELKSLQENYPDLEYDEFWNNWDGDYMKIKTRSDGKQAWIDRQNRAKFMPKSSANQPKKDMKKKLF